MKNLILTAAILAAQSSLALADGIRCRSVCLAFDGSLFTVFSLGEARTSGSRIYATAETLHAQAEKICRARAEAAGLHGPAILADSFRARAYRYDEKIDGYRHDFSLNIRLGKEKMDPRRESVSYSGYHYAETTAYRHREPTTRFHETTYDIRYWPSTAETACVSDRGIRDDETPFYSGDLPILAD